MKYYEPKNFDLQELVPKAIWEERGEKSLWLLDQNMLKMIDGIREFFGKPVMINNWHTGGEFQYRGYRPPDCKEGAKYSQHKFGRAADMDIKDYTAAEARGEIIKNQKSPFLSWITVLEDDVTWVHADCRNIKTNEIILIKP